MASVHKSLRKKTALMKGEVKLSAYMNHGLLTVHVVQGRHFSYVYKRNPNTFVMISLIPEDTDVTPTRCRTAIVTNSSCPAYNEKFSFELGDDDIHRRLLVCVYHRDYSGNHESLGCTSFGIRHLQQGRREISGWYYLLTDSVGRKKHLRVGTRNQPLVPVLPINGTSCQIPAVNQDVPDFDHHNLTIHRSQYGGFGFTVMDSCPAKIGHVDGSSRAKEVGLQKGDVVIRVNGQNVSRSTSVSVAKCIKKSGSKLQLEVQRPGQYATPTILQTSPDKWINDDTPVMCVHEEFTMSDDKTALLNSAVVNFKPFQLLHKLRSKSCFSLSSSRSVWI